MLQCSSVGTLSLCMYADSGKNSHPPNTMSALRENELAFSVVPQLAPARCLAVLLPGVASVVVVVATTAAVGVGAVGVGAGGIQVGGSAQ